MYKFPRKFVSAFLSAAIAASLCFSSALAEEIDISGDFSENENITLYEITDIELSSVPLGDAALLSIPSDAENELKAALGDAIENYTEADIMPGTGDLYGVKVSISDFNIDVSDSTSLSSVVQNVIYDNPLFFYVDYSHILYGRNANVFVEVYIPFKYSESEITQRLNEFKETADEIISEIGEKAETDFDIALLAHDYIVERCEYDYESFNDNTKIDAHGADAALIDHKAVCQGYASAYKYILTEMGVDCINVYDNNDSHEWSMIKLGDDWYHVDLTFDDPGRMGCVSHDYFLLTDTEIIEKASHSAWDKSTSYECNGESYSDAIWRNAETAVVYYGDDRYYAYSKAEDNSIYTAIYKVDTDFENESEFYRLSRADLWTTASGSYYINFFGGLYEYDDGLYFNTASALRKIYLDSDKIISEEICTADFSDADDNTETDTDGDEDNNEETVEDNNAETGEDDDTETGEDDDTESDAETDTAITRMGQICGSYLDGRTIYYAEGIAETSEAGTSISTDSDNVKSFALFSTEPEQNIEAVETVPFSIVEPDDEIGEATLEGTVTVELDGEITKNTDTAVYFGVYEDNVLKQIAKKSISENNKYEFSVNVGYNGERVYTYKVFAWGDTYKPYSQAFIEQINVSESESSDNETSEGEE